MIQVLLFLVCAHYLCDFALQTEFLAKGKNQTSPIANVPWYQCMVAHCAIHAGAVLLITGSSVLALLEFVFHFWIDNSKCLGKFGHSGNAFNKDQTLHILCKVAWWFSLVIFTGHYARG